MSTIQTFQVVGVDTDFSNHIVMPWNKGYFPNGASLAAVTAGVTIALAIPAFGTVGQASISETFASFEWTSTQTGGSITAGTEVALGQMCRRPRDVDTAKVHARVWVNETDRFTSLYLGLNDLSSNTNSANKLGSLTDATWTDIDFTQDISSWGDVLGVTIIAQGTNNYLNVGLTKFYIDFLAVELYTA